jgi:hypothetical protein
MEKDFSHFLRDRIRTLNYFVPFLNKLAVIKSLQLCGLVFQELLADITVLCP